MKRRQFSIITIISLFIMLCLSACVSQAHPSPPNGTIAQKQRDVTYPSVGGVTLAGTLVIPAHKSVVKVPGVIIVAGSGSVDRNGNEGTDFVTNLYSQLADLKANSKVPAQVIQSLATLFIAYNDEFWQGELRVDPAATLKRYAGPVLVLQGASDVQVFAKEDTPRLETALKSRTPDDHQITILPNTSHNMKAVQNPATDPGIAGPVVPLCTNTLRHWLAEKL